MTSLLDKLQSINDQGVKKIVALFRFMCAESEQLKKKLLSQDKEEKNEAREVLLTFVKLLKSELAKEQKEKGQSSEEIITQILKNEELTKKEVEEIPLINQMVNYCYSISFQKPKQERKKIKKIKG